MNEFHISVISSELGLKETQVKATVLLLQEGGTVPFISRYRKEATGSLDEVAVAAIRDRLAQLSELDGRREAIVKSLEERGLLTDVLTEKINSADTMTCLEDIYLPFRPRRKTRASIAKVKGLEPLAASLFEQKDIDPQIEAEAFVDPGKDVSSVGDALAGARDIIAETISEDAAAREKLRTFFAEKAMLRSKVVKGQEENGVKFRDYYDWEEPAAAAPSHRVLAIRRGESERFLSMRVTPPEDEAIALLEGLFIKGNGAASGQVRTALHDSYKRLLSSSMEVEFRLSLKKKADETAIRVFAGNLRELLLSSPLGRKRVLAIDPGFRTGCKVVCLDEQGKLLHNETVYPHFNEKGSRQAGERIRKLCAGFGTEAIAIGNGTAGRETEVFVRSLGLEPDIQTVMVNESGASIYSASEVAREEFPDQDITVRGAVSIGRRLMDPLAELVKIDPKSIGVGQYQHDVDEPALKKSLDDVVVSCVNGVGIEVNTASKQLLSYASGLGPQLAGNIVGYRNEHGPFKSRQELKKVPRLGPKAFEQAAGFLRIRDGGNPLDASAVHPESYRIVEAMAGDLNCSVPDLIGDEKIRQEIDLSRYMSDTVGMPTLTDIISELARPGRDPRDRFEAFSFAEGIEKIEDLRTGMTLNGIVTNVTAFGAFVDIGVHQDGLVHISELSDRYIKDPSGVVKVHQKVRVTVLDVDISRKRIALSMKSGQGKVAVPVMQKTEKKPAPKQEKTREHRPERFTNNPFADAFRKKK
jgi:uncharacterized protein